MKFAPGKIKKAVAIASIVAMLFVTLAMPFSVAQAQGPVPIGTGFDFNSIMKHLKDFVLDHLATLIAKQILHQMTISVVTWINSGFQGNPSFLKDPGSFFLDAADQVTGAFIATGGPLANLCSPFNVDIRLSLALQQSALLNQRYTCTLKSIIKTAGAGSGNINVSVNSGPNGATVGDLASFMGGDFSQGGWPAFVSMTTESQNNEYGAFLQANSDLQAKIAARHAAINTDLNRGNGFLSWQSCKEVDTIKKNDTTGLNTMDTLVESDPSVTSKTNKDGSVTYQTCQTQTPGSVISGTLQKQLNVPADELELANDINSVVDALVSQMVNQMLTKGLGALSSASGGHVSYTNQLQQEQAQLYTQEIGQSQQQADLSLSQSQSNLTKEKALYDQAVTAITESQSQYKAAKDCFSNKLGNSTAPLSELQHTYAENQIAAIDNILITKVNPLLNSLTSKQAALSTQLADVQNLQYQNTNSSGSLNAQATSQAYQNAVQTASTINASAAGNLATAQKDLTDAQKQQQAFDANAYVYQAACNSNTTIAP